MDVSVCDICGLICKGLKRHISSIHLKIKNLSCPECDYKTHNESHLNVHFLRKHTDTPFKCKFCNFDTKSLYALDRHRKTEHLEKIKKKIDVIT